MIGIYDPERRRGSRTPYQPDGSNAKSTSSAGGGGSGGGDGAGDGGGVGGGEERRVLERHFEFEQEVGEGETEQGCMDTTYTYIHYIYDFSKHTNIHSYKHTYTPISSTATHPLSTVP